LTPSLRRHGNRQCGQARPAAANGHHYDGSRHEQPTTPTTATTLHREATAGVDELMIRVGIPHDRYTVAFHAESCQMWVLDTAGHD
jgi:hypothetical protein